MNWSALSDQNELLFDFHRPWSRRNCGVAMEMCRPSIKGLHVTDANDGGGSLPRRCPYSPRVSVSARNVRGVCPSPSDVSPTNRDRPASRNLIVEQRTRLQAQWRCAHRALGRPSSQSRDDPRSIQIEWTDIAGNSRSATLNSGATRKRMSASQVGATCESNARYTHLPT